MAQPKSAAAVVASPVVQVATVQHPLPVPIDVAQGMSTGNTHRAQQVPTPVWLGLGANLGDRIQALRLAVRALGGLPGTQLVQVSSLYATASIPAGGPDYLNAVVEITTSLAPEALLRHLQAIELAAGRERPYRYAPRTLDVDVLLFGDESIHTPQLVVPHPRMYERAFVLYPLAELAPQHVTPEALAAVAAQGIERHEGPDWAYH